MSRQGERRGRMIAAVGAAALVVAVTVFTLVHASPRRGASARHGLPGHPEWRFASWGLQALGGFGYSFPRPGSVIWPTEGDGPQPTDWLAAQLVRVSTENTSLVIDCLVVPRDVGGLEGWFRGAPVTLWAHPTVELTPIADVDQAVARWIETGATVNIEMATQDGVATLRIADDEALVALELETSSG